MKALSPTERQGIKNQVLLVGGIGKLERYYKETIERAGLYIVYKERRISGGTPPASLAAIFVFSSIVSHPLKDKAVKLSKSCNVPIFYLKNTSTSALSAALDKLLRSQDGKKQGCRTTQRPS